MKINSLVRDFANRYSEKSVAYSKYARNFALLASRSIMSRIEARGTVRSFFEHWVKLTLSLQLIKEKAMKLNR